MPSTNNSSILNRLWQFFIAVILTSFLISSITFVLGILSVPILGKQEGFNGIGLVIIGFYIAIAGFPFLLAFTVRKLKFELYESGIILFGIIGVAVYFFLLTINGGGTYTEANTPALYTVASFIYELLFELALLIPLSLLAVGAIASSIKIKSIFLALITLVVIILFVGHTKYVNFSKEIKQSRQAQYDIKGQDEKKLFTNTQGSKLNKLYKSNEFGGFEFSVPENWTVSNVSTFEGLGLGLHEYETPDRSKNASIYKIGDSKNKCLMSLAIFNNTEIKDLTNNQSKLSMIGTNMKSYMNKNGVIGQSFYKANYVATYSDYILYYGYDFGRLGQSGKWVYAFRPNPSGSHLTTNEEIGNCSATYQSVIDSFKFN